MRDLGGLTADDFEPHRGDVFLATLDDADPVEVTLATVTRSERRSGERDPFSLVFNAPPDYPVQQAIHHLEHPVIGALEIFLVPIGADRDKVVYQAVFN